ncbi:uncharacterized protein LOC122315452 [Carya illinoinensis]|uniref:uncharacterized protein LOC122315452 n=1 Tax=Carya illinoinensis TaxID=32201 RepID=UPI001C718912|nr:uncharacterized protein LOC122315452 [Carya illinoinensis]
MVNQINKHVHGGNVLIKVDMVKAYNSIDWDFLLHGMRPFDFSQEVCGLISQCISSPWFSMAMNGTTKGFFPSGHGLRQGDPLLSYLFILVEEVLFRLLKNNFAVGKLESFSHSQEAMLISHLFYADDIMVFANGGGRWRSMPCLIGFSEGSFPVKYLGAPLVSSHLKVSHFDELVARIRDKLGGWQHRILSNGGWILLLRVPMEGHAVSMKSLWQSNQGCNCLGWSLVQVEVELDALLVVHWLERKQCGIWNLEDYWEEIQGLFFSM